jgi:hypothetical protein
MGYGFSPIRHRRDCAFLLVPAILRAEAAARSAQVKPFSADFVLAHWI